MSARSVISRLIDSRLVAGTVDRLGGWPVRLPSGGRARVATRTRSLRLDREPELTSAFLELLEPRELVVDGGAHWGLYSLMAAMAGCRVVAFEPSAHNRRQLASNLRLSGLSGSVELREEALWSERGSLEFSDYEGPSWGLSMMASARSRVVGARRMVPTIALDDLDLAPRVIKLDVEGAEAAALRGALRTLRDARPTLLVEVHRERLGESPDSLASTLRGVGYEVQVLASSSTDETGPVSHWVCRPPGP
jgi:FkbM family methyltransferase